MTASQDDTSMLLKRAKAGESGAEDELFMRHRDRLRKMVAIRIDGRLNSRVDPSDIVQETLLSAHHEFSKYLERPAISFYPWLRQIASNRLIDAWRRNKAQIRDVDREFNQPVMLNDNSAVDLASRFITPDDAPLERMARQELLQNALRAINKLDPVDHNIITMRILEQMTVREVAESLSLTKTAVKSRQYRAIKRVRSMIRDTENHGPHGGEDRDAKSSR